MVASTTAAAIVDDSVLAAFFACLSGPHMYLSISPMYMTLEVPCRSGTARLLGLVFGALTFIPSQYSLSTICWNQLAYKLT